MLPEITQLWSVNKLQITSDYSCGHLDRRKHQVVMLVKSELCKLASHTSRWRDYFILDQKIHFSSSFAWLLCIPSMNLYFGKFIVESQVVACDQ